MRINLYSIFDSAANSYRRPFFMGADREAVRAFTDLAVNAESDIGNHPEDYCLVRHAVFNEENGEVTAEAVTVLITGVKAVAESRAMANDLAPGELESVQ